MESLDDVWLWDPATRQMARSPQPSGAPWPVARSGHALAYDPVRGRVLLFGGLAGEARDDLWAFDTANRRWQDLTPVAVGLPGGSGPRRTGHALLVDDDRALLVLTGGAAGDAGMTDVWELDEGGSTWRLIADTTAAENRPAPRARDPMVFARGMGIFMIAPKAFSGMQQLWRWDPAARAWTGENLHLPRTQAPFYSMALAGRSTEACFSCSLARRTACRRIRLFWETWRASPLP